MIMKCGKCNIGNIKRVYKGIYEWHVCCNCDFKTEKKIRYGDNYEAIKAKQIKRVKEENGMMIKVDIETKIKILEFIKDNINVGLIQIGEKFNLSRFKIKSILIDFNISAYNTERKLNKTNWDKFIQNKIDLFKEKTYGT